ncbi:MAG: helix-turn-helix domain-containing protein, partial [Actinomycetota bacterium]|nr:helix-turn-helix domain-containing protein [Actinomycetota bacterium]
MEFTAPDEALLNVRETAERLKVHENTVRNWARSGVLPSARVPGSRFHRFYARDVERLREDRGRTVSSREQELRTIGPELVDASQLAQWAGTRDAQGRFPELVRRLLAATPGVTNISARAGEGVALSGWDGSADSAGTSFLPSGKLRMEFGVGANLKKKADEDYDKRLKASPNAADLTFVFLTPRRWRDGQSWA